MIRKQKIRSRRRGARVSLGIVGFFVLTAKILCCLALMAAAGLVGCAGYRFAVDSGHFTLKRLVIQGVSDEMAAELRTLVRPDPKKTVNLLLLKSDRVRDILLKHPRIESATVTKRYPNTLTILARERKPVAVVACGALYLIDKDGYVLNDASNLERDQLGFPFITGVEIGAIDFGQAIETKGVRTALDLFECLRRTNSRLARTLSEIRIEVDGGLTMVLSGGVEVRMGTDCVAERLAALELFMKEFRRLDRLEYIDLRIDDQIVYRLRNA